MSRAFILKCWPAGIFLAVMSLLAGCQSGSDISSTVTSATATPDLNASLAQAAAAARPTIILIVESGQSRADDRAHALFDAMEASGQLQNVLPLLLDLGASRNRATAARFHATNTPVLLGLSPKGLIVTRDEKQITKELILNRIAEVARRSPDLDTKFAALLAVTQKEGNSPAAELELGDFLLSISNAREAIPHFEKIAQDTSAATNLRVCAWVDLVRAHVWIAELEKARHEADNLIATLGPTSPEALAAGKFALGLEEIAAKHQKVARQQLQAAIAAAPESDYAKQAAATLKSLSAN
jgi:hypothetical protein